jgi:hypothetical protein
MKFMVEVRLKPDSKNKMVDAFEKRGPNRTPGVEFHGAWIGSSSDVLFVLVSSDSEAQVAGAAKSWGEIGEHSIHPVIDVQQY